MQNVAVFSVFIRSNPFSMNSGEYNLTFQRIQLREENSRKKRGEGKRGEKRERKRERKRGKEEKKREKGGKGRKNYIKGEET